MRHADAVRDCDVEHRLPALGVQLADLNGVLRREHGSAGDVAGFETMRIAIHSHSTTST